MGKTTVIVDSIGVSVNKGKDAIERATWGQVKELDRENWGRPGSKDQYAITLLDGSKIRLDPALDNYRELCSLIRNEVDRKR